MKKITFALFMSLQIVGFSQEDDKSSEQENNLTLKKNEIKVNLGMLVINMPEIYYERIISKNQSIGASLGMSIQNEGNSGVKYMFTPQYRIYFGKKRASGFFMEANASLYQERVNSYGYPYYNSIYYPTWSSKKQTNIGVGMAAGAKFLTENNWIGEFNLGIGTGLLYKDQYYEMAYYPRIGFSMGKRF